MNIRDAVRAMARRYPGGVESLAPRLPSKTASTLDKELRGAPGFKLGVDDAADIAEICYELGTPEALEFATAFAARMGCLLVPIPRGAMGSGKEAVRALAEHSRQSAELLASVCDTLADGDVNDNELRQAQAEGAEVVASVQQLLATLAELNRAGKPAA